MQCNAMSDRGNIMCMRRDLDTNFDETEPFNAVKTQVQRAQLINHKPESAPPSSSRQPADSKKH